MSPVHDSYPLSCHNKTHINKVNHIKPEVKSGLMFSAQDPRNGTFLPRAVYIRMDKRDVYSVIRGYLYLWPHLRKFHGCIIRNFIVSRKFMIHQEHVNIFLSLYCPLIKRKW